MCNGHRCIVSMADDITSERMDIHWKGNDKMGRCLDWNIGAGWMAISLFGLKEV